MREQILERASEYRELARDARLKGLWAAADHLSGIAFGLHVAAKMLATTGTILPPNPEFAPNRHNIAA